MYNEKKPSYAAKMESSTGPRFKQIKLKQRTHVIPLQWIKMMHQFLAQQASNGRVEFKRSMKQTGGEAG